MRDLRVIPLLTAASAFALVLGGCQAGSKNQTSEQQAPKNDSAVTEVRATPTPARQPRPAVAGERWLGGTLAADGTITLDQLPGNVNPGPVRVFVRPVRTRPVAQSPTQAPAQAAPKRQAAVQQPAEPAPGTQAPAAQAPAAQAPAVQAETHVHHSTAGSSAGLDPDLMAYTPVGSDQLTGTIVSIGSDTMDQLMQKWEEQFGQMYPNVRIRHDGRGSSTAAPNLTEGVSTFGPMSRAVREKEKDEFAKKYGYDPTEVRVCIDMLAVYVHPSNPLAQSGMDFTQLDSIFSNSRLRGGAEVNTWGDVGLTGDWERGPITVYSRDKASGTYSFFRENVLGKDGEFKTTNRELEDSGAVVDGVANNKFAIGYSGIGYKTANVATVPLAEKPDGDKYPTEAEFAYTGQYPLARPLLLIMNYEPGSTLDPVRAEFLKYILSKQGQQIVLDLGFVPLTADLALEELREVGLAPAASAAR